MTTLSFRFLCVILVVATLVGGYLLAPSRAELEHTEMSCDEWFADPRSGSVTLTDCALDLRRARRSRAIWSEEEVIVAVRPTGWAPPGDDRYEEPGLVLLSHSPQHRALASHVAGLAHPLRFERRYRDELVQHGDVSGTIELDGVAWDTADQPVAAPVLRATRPRPPLGRAFGIVLSLFGLLGLLVLVPLQRKWTRNRSRLTGKGKPLSF